MKRKIKILLFFLLFFTTVGVVLSYSVRDSQKKKINDPKNNISIIIQTGMKKEALKSMYLAELLGLSIDQSINIYNFNEEEAQNKLLQSPLIEEAVVKKYKPNAVYVDYKVRTPLFLLADFTNVAVDVKGVAFPFFPFFPPKNLPELYLGEASFTQTNFWQTPLEGEKFSLALDILNSLKMANDSTLILKTIDLSNAYAKSYGKKEIVITLEHKIYLTHQEKEITFSFPRILRLCVKDYEIQLGNYFSLNKKMIEDYKKQIKINDNMPSNLEFSTKVIDMRILKQALIDE